MRDLSVFGDTAADTDIVQAAWPIHTRYRFSWFDCLVLSSADRLANPFTTDPVDILS